MKHQAILGIVVTIIVLAPGAFVGAQQPKDPKSDDDAARRRGHLEVPGDAFVPAPRIGQARSPAPLVVRNGFASVQVNVDGDGLNIVGDAANEPSIAVDPTNPLRMAIGWRQFDTIASDFRQAGWGYTADGGQTWTFPGVIEPGIFRSDPVLDADADGNFYYNSLTANVSQTDFWCHVFKSTDGGASWDAGTYAFGGDKQWQAIDTTSGIGRGNIYASWNEVFSTCSGHFTRSVDDGQTFQSCTTAPGSPYWGTLAVGPDGELYLSGTGFVVDKSTTAQDPGQSMQWQQSVSVSLGGSLVVSSGPNPGGLLGQTWVAVDHSNSPTRGNVYLLASVDPAGADPLDVRFARSTNGGQTFSASVRVNDDVGTDAWQWFGTMSVAPNGRIDVIWLDTRADPGGYDSELYYSYSTDAGVTWAANVALSPAFDPHVGWPQQSKMGDYFDMISDDFGADLAYAATFNGEQDVYYIRIGDPHCSDLGDVSFLSSKYNCESTATVSVRDCNANTDPGIVETQQVTVDSDTEPAGELVILTETGPNTATFEGSVDLSETDSAGVLQVADRDTLTATYIDADDGQGGFNVPVIGTALVDCGAPVISNVQVAAIGDDTATVTFDTDEATIGTVRYGLSCGTLTGSESDIDYETAHTIALSGLSFDTPYFFVVDAEDDQANLTTDDNGGACYAFSTPGLIYDFPMDTDPGWTTAGQWAFGQPTGGGGQYGGPDPTAGFTGSNVYGYNLSGDYGNGLAETHLTSTPFDCTGLSHVRLRFQRWLGVEGPTYDHAYVRVSNDGFFWTTVWANGMQYDGGPWTQVDYDISAIADGQPTVYLRWTMGSTDGSWRFCGWNIDDVQIIAVSDESGPCAAVGARSCRDHGGTVLCLDLFARETEPRLGGTQELEIDLDDASGFGAGVSVSCVNSGDQSGLVSGTSTAGNTVTVTFSPALPDGDTCTVSLDCGASVCVRNVEGDINGDGATTTGDASIIKPQFNRSAAAAGPEFDFDVDGLVTTGDFSQVKPTFNNTAPACP